jgi:hypothetical protein
LLDEAAAAKLPPAPAQAGDAGYRVGTLEI